MKQPDYVNGKKRYSKAFWLWVALAVIAAVVLCFMYPVLNNPNSGISADNAVLVTVIGSALAIWISVLLERIRVKNFDDFAYEFRNLLSSDRYFAGDTWKRKYRRYRDRHSLHSLNSHSLLTDLSFRYIRMALWRDWYLWLFIIPASGMCGYVLVSTLFNLRFPFDLLAFILIGSEALYLLVIVFLSFRFFGKWLKKHPHYQDKRDEIAESYLNGYAFECAHFCLVIGNKYIHGFDGHEFHTVERSNVCVAKWLVERLHVYTTMRCGSKMFVRDEYRFNINFACGGQDSRDDFHIALDQFQIGMVMELVIPKVSSNVHPIYVYDSVDWLRHVSIRWFTSAPVME